MRTKLCSTGLMHEELEAQTAAWVGQTIAEKYRVDAVLGMGGMGAVFRCHHLGLLRDVAVKLLHAAFMEDPNLSPRFDREAQSASRLEHPNCIRVMDYGTWQAPDAKGPMKYMVLELLEGGDLADYIGGPMAPSRVVDLGVQLMRGLEHAHARGVVHRDLKPENVFVTTDHEGKELLKLVDFGLAKVVSGEGSEAKLTRTGMVFGTPHYMSPEQATGMASDERTDIYAAGIMLWELLAGHAPFDGDDPISIIRQQVAVALPAPPPQTPPALAQLIAAMTIKEADLRTTTATLALHQLEAMRSGAAAPLLPEAAAVQSAPPLSAAPTGQQRASTLVSVGAGASATHSRIADVSRVAGDMGKQVGLSPRATLGIAATVGALIVVGLIAVLAGKDGDAQADSNAQGPSGALQATVASKELEAPLFSGVDESELQALDKLIDAQADADAQAMLDKLLKAHPDLGVLHLRRGLLFARQEGRIEDAIAAFDRGFELSPQAVEDDKLFETVARLVRNEAAGPAALELCLARLGERGHPLLLEMVNRKAKALAYNDRHRVLAALEGEAGAAVDQILNRNLDLWQAVDSGRPCEVYGATLDAMQSNPDPAYVGSLLRSRAPGGTKSGTKATSNTGRAGLISCPGLDKRRAEVADSMAVRYPAAAKKKEVPSDYAKPKSRRPTKKKKRLRDLFQ